MTETHAITHTALVVGGLSGSRVGRVERLVLHLPALAEGALRSADLGLLARSGELFVELSLSDTPAAVARIRQRVAFWLAREGGSSRALEGMGVDELLRFRNALRTAELSVRDASPSTWARAIRGIFAAAGAEDPGEAPGQPELRLHLDGTGWQGFCFDRSTLRLDVPSPIAPPSGDALRVVLEGAGQGARCEALARVISVRAPTHARAGAPAGFTLVLAEGSEEAARLLAARCSAFGVEGSTRAAPRYHVALGAALADPGEELRYESGDAFQRDYLANLSHGGAFVRTTRSRRIGDRVSLHLRLPGGPALAVPATVVHRTGGGVGLQFELTHPVADTLAAAIAGLAARPRRVLIVDDDALVRKILSDAFEARGFEARTAANGELGLRAIADELFGLDAVVTDVQMPSLSGEALVSAVRSAGGEGELAIVVVGASIDPELTARLEAAGADRILSKRSGVSAVVDAVDEVLRVRATLLPVAANEGDPFSPSARPALAMGH